MQYEMSRLIRLTGWLAEQYTSKDTSSITYETAEMLMEAVLYCINEYEDPGEPGEHGDVSGEDDGVQAERVPAARLGISGCAWKGKAGWENLRSCGR